jgi:hypothetical protein
MQYSRVSLPLFDPAHILLGFRKADDILLRIGVIDRLPNHWLSSGKEIFKSREFFIVRNTGQLAAYHLIARNKRRYLLITTLKFLAIILLPIVMVGCSSLFECLAELSIECSYSRDPNLSRPIMRGKECA